MAERKLIYADTVVEKLSELIALDDHEKKVVESYVEKCMAVQQWISVTESIPEQYHTVIGWTSLREMGEVYHNGYGFVWEDSDCECPAMVTHWMPMPEPPNL